MWYPKMAKFADVTGEAMTCPWGTYQGGWVPFKKYDINKKYA